MACRPAESWSRIFVEEELNWEELGGEEAWMVYLFFWYGKGSSRCGVCFWNGLKRGEGRERGRQECLGNSEDKDVCEGRRGGGYGGG